MVLDSLGVGIGRVETCLAVAEIGPLIKTSRGVGLTRLSE